MFRFSGTEDGTSQLGSSMALSTHDTKLSA